MRLTLHGHLSIRIGDQLLLFNATKSTVPLHSKGRDMLKGLSQRTLNNIVILAMVVMMALFNLDKLLPQASTPSALLLIQPDTYLLKVEHGTARLERVGQQWRQSGAKKALSVSPQLQLTAWKRALLSSVEAIPESLLSQQPHIVVIWLAGEPKGRVYALYEAQNEIYVEHQSHWYRLDHASISELLPWLEE